MDKFYQQGHKDARPNEATYTSVLNSCAYPSTLDPKTRRNAWSTAVFTLNELRSSRYGHPNELTYGTFLQACSNLLSDDEENLRDAVAKTFHQCCDDGQVGNLFLTLLRKVAPPDLTNQLLEGVYAGETIDVSMKDVPPRWKRNVRTGPVRTKEKNPTGGKAGIQIEACRQIRYLHIKVQIFPAFQWFVKVQV